ncbi:hypothetical protein AJ79_10274 [Helicocarpus griseus UAMH5409]|uniref:Uncharacterized protein n=1 Tax=Helicocarpus griseus UAMH5409 TaxID=1447875 RepID=A0A2B7WEP6_9EURO|nr:hypothetical protein AJ79_10274 [Helicocarpus griseus UAMH5409]
MPLDGIKNIVLVLSGKGGVGKSSVTLQLALALSLQGRSVGILDVDLTGPSIPRLVGKEDAKITQAPGGWVPVIVHPGAPTAENSTTTSAPATTTTTTVTSTSSTTTAIPQPTPPPPRDSTASTPPQSQSQNAPTPARGPLRCMSLGFLLRDRGDAVIWRGPKKTAMVRQFLTDVLWGDTDYLLIDTPPGTSDEHIALAEQLLTVATTSHPTTASAAAAAKPRLTGAVLVTTPQAISTADVRKELNFCAKTRIPVIGVVENMAGYTCPCCGEMSNVFSKGGGRVMAEEMGVRFLGEVPVDVGFGEMVEGVKERKEREGEEGEGELLVEKYQRCWSRPLFEGFARTVIEEAEGGGEGGR